MLTKESQMYRSHLLIIEYTEFNITERAAFAIAEEYGMMNEYNDLISIGHSGEIELIDNDVDAISLRVEFTTLPLDNGLFYGHI